MTTAATTAPGLRSSRWVRVRKRLAPGRVSFDPWIANLIPDFLAFYCRDRQIVEVGSNTHILDARVVRLDIDHAAGANVIGDGHERPFAAGSVDAFLHTGALEHVVGYVGKQP